MILAWADELFIDDEKVIVKLREFTNQEELSYSDVLSKIKKTSIKNFFDRL